VAWHHGLLSAAQNNLLDEQPSKQDDVFPGDDEDLQYMYDSGICALTQFVFLKTGQAFTFSHHARSRLRSIGA